LSQSYPHIVLSIFLYTLRLLMEMPATWSCMYQIKMALCRARAQSVTYRYQFQSRGFKESP
jgi:hypothetical protein